MLVHSIICMNNCLGFYLYCITGSVRYMRINRDCLNIGLIEGVLFLRSTGRSVD